MRISTVSFLVFAGFACVTPPARAQKAPEAGYIFPAGGKAGATVDVRLGGYDWTPDMEYFVHDQRVKLIASGPPGPILIAPPPYWFGQKGRLVSMPLAREVSAKVILPANLPPGPIYWQAANANGVTDVRVFIVGNGTEIVEEENRRAPQLLPSLPISVSGRLFKNEEVDRYRFIADKDGPITCELLARRLGAKFHGVLQVHDAKGQMIADTVGVNGTDPSITFVAKAKAEYIVSVQDIDFGGDRSYVYRLEFTPGPRVVGAIPAAGKRGETREVEFVVDTGTKLESIKRSIIFPATGNTLDYRLVTPAGAAPAFTLPLSDQPGITGVLDQPDTEHRHPFAWKKGEVWSLALESKRFGSPLDVALAIIGPDAKELAKNDDLPGTTDAGLEFTVPADGTYQVVVSDMAGKSGARSAIYRLVAHKPMPDFSLQLLAPRASVQVGGKLDLPVNVLRTGGFKGPIALTVKGLPAGVTAPPNLVIPGDKASFALALQVAKDAGTLASLVTIEGTADLSPRGPGVLSRIGPPPAKPDIVTRSAHARTTYNLAARSPEENQTSAILVATTLKQLFKGRPVDQDTGRKVHRGSTHPAEVIVERLDGFNGEIILQMAATQSYQMQGITGGEVLVPPGVGKTIYPVFMPEWLETTRTSRCGMIAVAKVTDAKGKVRWACSPMAGYITMTLEGALLKVSADEQDMTVPANQPFDVSLKLARLTKLNQPAKLELRLPEELVGQLKAEAMVIPVKQEHAVMRITPAPGLLGLHTFTVRATAMQDGKYLAISETPVTVEFLPSVQTPRK